MLLRMDSELRQAFDREVEAIKAMPDARAAQRAAKALGAECAELASAASDLRGQMVLRRAEQTGEKVRELAKHFDLSTSQTHGLLVRGRKQDA